MTDSYTIEGVTITPQGGGVYLVSHPSFPEVKERGKDTAEARAREMAQLLAAEADAPMPAQAPLAQVAAAQQADPAEVVDEVAALRAQLAKTQAENAELASKVATRTVETAEPAPEAPAKVPAGIPRRFAERLDDKAKAEMKRLGIGLVDIILEENESIPPTGLFIGHNGRGYSIVPGEPVTVPSFLLGVLDDAVMSAPVVDKNSNKVLGYRSRMKYPYRRL